MEIVLSLCLPRDKASVPVARHMVKAVMENAGVSDDCVHAVEVALTEACANVMHHAGPGDDYEVRCHFDQQLCVLRVVDTGRGFDFESLGEGAGPTDERGRGISLIQALADEVKFVSRPERGTIVHLEKALEYEEGSLLGP